MQKSFKKGFTLLEILLVVGIIAILAGIVIVAINPAKQLATVRNTERKSDIKQLNSAVLQFYIDHGFFPASTTDYSSIKAICNTGSAISSNSCSGLVNLTELVPDYIQAIPTDPQTVTGASSTKYEIIKNASNNIGFNSAGAELLQSITLGVATGTGGGTSYSWSNPPSFTGTTITVNNPYWGSCTGELGYAGVQSIYVPDLGTTDDYYEWTLNSDNRNSYYAVSVASPHTHIIGYDGNWFSGSGITWGGTLTYTVLDWGWASENASATWGVAPAGW